MRMGHCMGGRGRPAIGHGLDCLPACLPAWPGSGIFSCKRLIIRRRRRRRRRSCCCLYSARPPEVVLGILFLSGAAVAATHAPPPLKPLTPMPSHERDVCINKHNNTAEPLLLLSTTGPSWKIGSVIIYQNRDSPGAAVAAVSPARLRADDDCC